MDQQMEGWVDKIDGLMDGLMGYLEEALRRNILAIANVQLLIVVGRNLLASFLPKNRTFQDQKLL